MPETNAASEHSHIASTKYVSHQPGSFVHADVIAMGRRDAGGILPAMLQQQQSVVKQLIYGLMANDADNATHNWILIMEDARDGRVSRYTGEQTVRMHDATFTKMTGRLQIVKDNP